MQELRALLHEGCGEAGRGRRGLLRPSRQYGAHRDGIARRSVSDPRAAYRGGGRGAGGADGRTKVGILGTKYTMNGPVYPGALGRRGIGWAVPSAEDQKIVNDVIFDELCLGEFTDKSRDAYVRDHREAEAGRLRRGRAGLHGNPAADHAGRLALADAGFDAAARESGRRGRDRRTADAGLAGRPAVLSRGRPSRNH